MAVLRAVRNALLPGKSASRANVLPAVTFTYPEVARVGLTEAEACEHLGDAIHVHKTPITNADRAVCDGEHDGFIKLITRRKGKLVGATIVASRAGEMIVEVALAMEQGLGVDAIAETAAMVGAPAMTARKPGLRHHGDRTARLHACRTSRDLMVRTRDERIRPG